MKKILLIAPLAKEGSRTSSSLRMPQISLYYLAALIPEDRYEIKVIEEEHSDVNLEEKCDLISISIMTANAKRGYYFADEFRKRGKKVIIGGIHATAMPNEALQHADAVCVGEAESIWSKVLEDLENNSMNGIYNGGHPDLSDPAIAPQPRLDLTPKSMWDVKPLVCTRGCPYNCSFCSVHKFYGRKLRHVPPKTIAEVMDKYETKNWMFLDDNVIGHPGYAKELFDTIAPLKKRWLSQASIAFIHDTELMKKAAKSGCAGLFFGLENVTVQNRSKLSKNAKNMEKIEESIKMVKDLGIIFHASLVFGFDDDAEETFEETLEFLMRNKIPSVSFNVLTPYPGTDIYDQLKSEDRILSTDWNHYDHCTAVYKPMHFSARRLMELYSKIRVDFYSYSSIFKRVFSNPHPIFLLLMNMGYHSSSKSKKNSINLPEFSYLDSCTV